MAAQWDNTHFLTAKFDDRSTVVPITVLIYRQLVPYGVGMFVEKSTRTPSQSRPQSRSISPITSALASVITRFLPTFRIKPVADVLRAWLLTVTLYTKTYFSDVYG